MSDDTIHKAKTSLIWSGIEKFSVQGIGFIITIIISRLITPQDYGLIAMLSIFIVIAQVIIDCGLSNSLIQNQNRTQYDFSTVFFLNISIGISCYIILFIGAPYIAAFYNNKILEKILQVYAIVIIINSFALVQRTIIYIDNKYRLLSIITIFSIFVSGIISIYLAYCDYGVWALASYYIAQSLICSILLWITSNWRPQFVFNNESAKKAIDFGWKLLLANLINSIVSNLYTLVIGKRFNATELGYYGRGQSISYLYPSNISNMFNQAVFPILCEVQNDNQRLNAIFIKYIKIASFVTFLPLAMLTSLAEPIILTILGSNWLPAVPFLQILSIAYMLDPIMRLNSIVLNVKGNTSYSLKSEIIKKICLLTILFATLEFGTLYIATGVIFYSVIDLIIVSKYVKKVMSLTIWDEIRAFSPMLILSITLMIVIYILGEYIESNIILISISIIIFVVVALIGSSIININVSSILKNFK